MDELLAFQDAKGRRISAVFSGPSPPAQGVVVLCHGFLSSKNSTTNKALTRMLNEAGIATFRFDFFG
jgi:predicted alpha/beta-hydrolase family hydrolase